VSGSRLVLLGTGGGPMPKATRSAPAYAVVVDGMTYIVDCGNGVARQMAKAGLGFRTLRAVFVTHHHSDHNADYGNLFLLLWTGGLDAPVDAFGPQAAVEGVGAAEGFIRVGDAVVVIIVVNIVRDGVAIRVRRRRRCRRRR